MASLRDSMREASAKWHEASIEVVLTQISSESDDCLGCPCVQLLWARLGECVNKDAGERLIVDE